MADMVKGNEGKIRMTNEQIGNQGFGRCFNAIREVKWRPKIANELHKVAKVIDEQIKLLNKLAEDYREKHGMIVTQDGRVVYKVEPAPEKKKEDDEEWKELMDIEFELPIDKKIEIKMDCSELEILHLGDFINFVE